MESTGRQPASSSAFEKDVVTQSTCAVENTSVDRNADGDNHESSKDSMDLLSDDVVDSSTDNAIEECSGTSSGNTDADIITGSNACNDQNGLSSDSAIDTNTEDTDDSVNTGIGISSNAAANESTAALEEKNTFIAVDANTDTTVATSADSTVDANDVAPTCLNMDPAVDVSIDAVSSGISASSKDTVDSNIDTTVCKNTCAEVVASKDDFDSGSTSLAIELVDGRKDTTSNEGSNSNIELKNHPVTSDSPDATSDTKTNNDFVESVLNLKKEEGLNGLKCPLSPGHKMGGQSADPVQTSKIPKDVDCQYDSEIEIIDDASVKHEDKPATENGAVSNTGPEFVADVSDDTSFDAHSDAAVNSNSNDISAHNKRSRLRKREIYEQRCRNMRLNKMKLKAGDASLPAKPKSKTSNCLDKLTQNNLKFMENFDPKRSNRERRKLLRKTNATRNLKRDLYGLNGTLISSGKNLCDCMNPHCPGCHFPCPRCSSPKCGHECRVNRKWTYEEIEIDGTDIVIKPQELIDSFLCQS